MISQIFSTLLYIAEITGLELMISKRNLKYFELKIFKV